MIDFSSQIARLSRDGMVNIGRPELVNDRHSSEINSQVSVLEGIENQAFDA
jgi:hypothetical protein